MVVDRGGVTSFMLRPLYAHPLPNVEDWSVVLLESNLLNEDDYLMECFDV
jgi:hypothetical protein